MKIPRVCRGTIIEANHTNYRYKIKTDSETPQWYKVNQITSRKKIFDNRCKRVKPSADAMERSVQITMIKTAQTK